MELDKFKNRFCINLKRREDRWKDSIKEFEKNRIKFVERFEAIDSLDLKDESVKIKKGAYCLSLTIQKLLIMAKEKNYEHVMIFEDDVTFHNDFKNLSDKFLTDIKSKLKDWDMIYFGVNNITKPIKVSDNINKLTKAYSAHCMIIRNTMYDEILNLIEIEGKNKEIDVIYGEMHKYTNSYCSNPALASQREGFSDIECKVVKSYVS